MKNFINIADIDKKDLRGIIDHAKLQKKKRSSLKKSAIDPEIPLADKTLIMIFEKDFLNNVKKKGEYFDKALNKIKKKYPKIIGEIRGIGLMKGLKMLVDNVEFMKKLMKHKMLTVKAEENVIRLYPPLIVSNKELDEAIAKIEKVCQEMS